MIHFPPATSRKDHRLMAAFWLLIALLPVILSIWNSIDNLGIIFGIIWGCFFICKSIYHFYKYRKTSVDTADTKFFDIRKQPPEVQIHVSKRVIWIMLLLIPVLTLWTYSDLSALEDGSKAFVTVHEPVALLYNLFGFWPAVLCWPVFGLIICSLAIFRIRKVRSVVANKTSRD